MIYVSQGHEQGIGLEIFFKAVIQLPKRITSMIEIHGDTDQLKKTIQFLDFEVKVFENYICVHGIKIAYKKIIEAEKVPSSTQSLLSILEIITPKDILITLPTSKNQLFLNQNQCSGYTEFFRNYYNNREISMIFHSNDLDVLLLTDHVPLNKVIPNLSEDLILKKLSNCIDGIKNSFYSLDEVLFSGINPHAGEGGILGSEDDIIHKAIVKIRKKYSRINFSGPLPGDTLHFHRKDHYRQLFVYSFHDQGLPFFKNKYGLFGINITMGLPFLRLSVDHGTAFDLYGKNSADSGGLVHVFHTAYEVVNR